MNIAENLKKIGVVQHGKNMVVTPEPTEEQKRQMQIEAAKIIDDINRQEEECLQKIHTRFCIVKGFPINIGDVSRYTAKVHGHPTYYEYWYKLNTSEQAFLMSREIVDLTTHPKLNVLFSRELARGDENSADK